MGCFCRHQLPPLRLDASLQLDAKLQLDLEVPPVNLIIGAVGSWLSARWLPALPWVPDPLWLEIDLPTLQIPPLSLSVLASLAFAAQTCQATFGLDITNPLHVNQLVRIVATLNARLELLQQLELDARPWLSLLQLNAQADLVQSAVAMNLFVAPPQWHLNLGLDLTLGPWHPFLLRLKALAPLIAIGQMLKLDWTLPNVMALLAAKIRLLARITLPPLLNLNLVLNLVARLDAIARLQASLGLDPRLHAFLRIRAMVVEKARLAASLLPPSIRLEGGQLVGMPHMLPNPGLILNAGTIKLAGLLTPHLVAQLRWQVPAFDQLPLLTVGLPVAHLAGAMAKLGIDPIRLSPCGPLCDAAQVMRALAPNP